MLQFQSCHWRSCFGIALQPLLYGCFFIGMPVSSLYKPSHDSMRDWAQERKRNRRWRCVMRLLTMDLCWPRILLQGARCWIWATDAAGSGSRFWTRCLQLLTRPLIAMLLLTPLGVAVNTKLATLAAAIHIVIFRLTKESPTFGPTAALLHGV